MSGFFDRLDKNGDGKLGGDEISGAGFFQGMLDRAGIKEGATREDFTRGFEKAREEMQGGRDSNGGDRNRGSSSGFTPMKRERVTMDLQSAYADRDLDGDGQLGLYEWRDWDRTRVDEFFFLDSNGDGFLTPQELAAVDSGNGGNSNADSGSDRGRSRDRDRERRPESQPPQVAAAPTPPASSAPLDESDADVLKGRQIWTILDANHDGQASVEELARLKKLRPILEGAGVRLDQPMTSEQFVANYVKAVKQ
jgi:hypothetical protein